MQSRRPAAALFAAFAAGAALMVLQLAASRLLSPLVGSSLETWTALIAAFMLGGAAGNRLGGRLADRGRGAGALAVSLILGAVAAAWLALLPHAAEATGAHRLLPLGLRIPVVSLLAALPLGLALGVPAPLAVRLGASEGAGKRAGSVFALGALGSLAGAAAAGFYLIPTFTLDAITAGSAAVLLLAAGVVLAAGKEKNPSPPTPLPLQERGEQNPAAGSGPPSPEGGGGGGGGVAFPEKNRTPLSPLLAAFSTGFAVMAVELAASRLLAQVVGVSLYTWTGVIGAVLAGGAVGNALGGRLAAGGDARRRLALALVAGAAGVTIVFPTYGAGLASNFLADAALPTRALGWAVALALPPALLLGLTSPLAVRLAAEHAGAGGAAGRVGAAGTAGALIGTFVSGYLLVPSAGAFRTLFLTAGLPLAAACLVRGGGRGAMAVGSLVGGLALAGLISTDPRALGIERETGYFTIRVLASPEPTEPSRPSPVRLARRALLGPAGATGPAGSVRQMLLDRLVHSTVDVTDPTYLKYTHEQVQMEFLRHRLAAGGGRVLVVGGGGYTYPRAARALEPASRVTVVEIDPGVTAVAVDALGLDPALGVEAVHLDGRQFLADRAPPGGYDLVILDAVNDLSVPAHLMTKEFHALAGRALAKDGVYLVSLIDRLDRGRVWAAARNTLGEVFPHVELLQAEDEADAEAQRVYVVAASFAPLDVESVRAATAARGLAPFTRAVPAALGGAERARGIAPVLSDQFAPVDNLMAPVFRDR